MKSSIIKTLLLAVILVSCNVLEPEPKSDILAANFWKSAEHAEAGISAAYDFAGQSNITRNNISFLTIASDESRNVPGTSGSRSRMEIHQFSASRQGHIRDTWRETYTALQRINDVLENVPNIEDPNLDRDGRRGQYIGEAYFLRAYCHFFLTRIFDRVPLSTKVTKSVEDVDVDLPCAEPKDIFDLIILDLEEAIARLPEEHSNEIFTRGRATKGAAQALLSKVYLWRGHKAFGGGNADFSKSAELANEVINSPLYNLVPGTNYSSIFSAGAQATSETIWEQIYDNDQINGNGLQDEFQPVPVGQVRNVPTQKLLDAFDARLGDLRKAITIKDVPNPDENNNEPYYTGKHEQIELDDPNVVILRLADIILVRAEALNEQGQTGEAIILLDEIRQRAGLDPTAAASQDEVRDAILEERFVELAFEGKRWYDLRRHDRVVQEVDAISAENNNLRHVLWPIPVDDRLRNPNLCQNPGYEDGE